MPTDATTDALIADRYILGDVIGIGGMGIVYAATSTSSRRSLAIKLPRPELAADPHVLRRFREEANAGVRIDHANVVHVLDSGSTRGTPYLVMERVTGSPLSHGEQEGVRSAHSAEYAARIILQVVAGLEAMHALGIVHGDVKGDNVIVTTRADGEVSLKLIDLGLARFADDTWDGVVSGTPEYLAPEVFQGQQPTFMSDQYAVGCLLYELLVGTVPFAAPSTELLARRHMIERTPDVASQRPDLACAPALDGILMRAMAKRPEDRFTDIRAFGDALLRAVPGAAVTSPTRTIEPSKVRRGRIQLAVSLDRGAPDQIVRSCLDLVGTLIDAHRLEGAIGVIEEVLPLVSDHEAQWRLELSLAAMYDGHGDRAHARRIALQGRNHARACGSIVGCNRAEELLARLGDRRRDEATTAMIAPRYARVG